MGEGNAEYLLALHAAVASTDQLVSVLDRYKANASIGKSSVLLPVGLIDTVQVVLKYQTQLVKVLSEENLSILDQIEKLVSVMEKHMDEKLSNDV